MENDLFFTIPEPIAERMNPKELAVINALNEKQNRENRFYCITAEMVQEEIKKQEV